MNPKCYKSVNWGEDWTKKACPNHWGADRISGENANPALPGVELQDEPGDLAKTGLYCQATGTNSACLTAAPSTVSVSSSW